jgi:ABC-2 type transport system permease protein
MWKLLKDLDKHRDLIAIMVSRNLKIRYKRSVLGFFWTLLNPLFFILIYAVFLKILKYYRADDQLFLPVLVTGIITWQFLAMCVGDCLNIIVGNSNLISRTVFPRMILPLAATVGNLVNFLLSMLILMCYVLILKASNVGAIDFTCIGLLPITVLTQFALCLGLGLILSALNVFFRDTEHIVSVGMLAWFFLTPVIYYLSAIPAGYQRLAFLNPMTGIVTAYRAACLGTGIMAPRLVLMSFCVAWIVCFAGIVFFQRVQARFVDEL